MDPNSNNPTVVATAVATAVPSSAASNGMQALVIVPPTAVKAGGTIKVRTATGAAGQVVTAQPLAAGERASVSVRIISQPYKPEIQIERGVFFGQRKFMDVPCAIIFVVLTVATLILALTTIAGAPPSLFDEGGIEHFTEQHQKCMDASQVDSVGSGMNGIHRQLLHRQLREAQEIKSVWGVFEKAVHIPIVLVLLVFAVAFGWLLTLQKAARGCVYATEHIKAGCCFFAAYVMSDQEDKTLLRGVRDERPGGQDTSSRRT